MKTKMILAAALLAVIPATEARNPTNEDVRSCILQSEAGKVVMMNRQLENNMAKTYSVLLDPDMDSTDPEVASVVRTIYSSLIQDAYNRQWYPERWQQEAAAEGFSNSVMRVCMEVIHASPDLPVEQTSSSRGPVKPSDWPTNPLMNRKGGK